MMESGKVWFRLVTVRIAPVPGCCEDGTEPSVLIHNGYFIDQPRVL
jgi:hypothetical protein